MFQLEICRLKKAKADTICSKMEALQNRASFACLGVTMVNRADINYQSSTETPGEMALYTVCVVDMVDYNSSASILEDNISAKTVTDLNRQIQELFQGALKRVPDMDSFQVVSRPGDGIILLFERADNAHDFGREVHILAARHSASRKEPTAKRWFRVGISTGNVNTTKSQDGSNQYAGTAIAAACRLEAAARAGEIVLDVDSYNLLHEEIKELYGPEELISGKRQEQFLGHRCLVVNRNEGTSGDAAWKPKEMQMAGTMLRDARRAFVITAVGGLLSALLLFARHIYVQRESVEYSGVVRQSSGPGIPEAEVKAMAGQSIAFVTHTDSTGIFHTVLPSSSKVIHLLVQAPGYATRTSVIDLSTGTSEDIVLEKESAVLPQTAPQGPSVKVEAHGYKSSAINGNDNVVH